MAIARRCDRCLNFYNEIVYNHPDAKIEVSTNITDALCTKPNNKIQYSQPYIQVTRNNLINKENLESIVNGLFKNTYTACAKWSFNINKEIIETISNIKYKIISEINIPMFLFIIFDFFR